MMPRPNPVQRCRAIGTSRGISIASSWSPTLQSGLLSLYDWTSVVWSEVARTTHPTVADDPFGYWDDAYGSRDARITADADRVLYQPTEGPSAGKFAVEWTTGDGALYYATGSELLSGQSFTMAAIFNPTAAGAISGICGRGGYNNVGSYIRLNASNVVEGIVRAGSTVTLTEPGGAAVGAYKVVVLTYDGANARLCVRGKAVQTAAVTGDLVFHASDLAFWIGATTPGSIVFAWGQAKHIAAVAVWSSSVSATGIVSLADNFAKYAGLS